MVGVVIFWVVIFILSGGLWWFLAVVRPWYLYTEYQLRPTIMSTVLLSVGLTSFGYSLLISLHPTEILFLFLFTPITILVAIGYAFSLHLYAAIFSASLIFAGHIIATKILKKTSRLAISTITAILLLLIPLFVENQSSNRKIITAFKAVGGDCLKARSFYSSLRSFGHSSRGPHAATHVDGIIFYWSYRDQQFLS